MPKKSQVGGGLDADTARLIELIEEHGAKAVGKDALIRHLRGEKLTQKEMMNAKCYECTGWYGDGTDPCEIIRCPLQPMMPYRIGGVRKLRRVAPGTVIGVPGGGKKKNCLGSMEQIVEMEI